MKREDGDDPAIDARARRDIGVVQHPFDVARIDFDDQVANSNEIQLERAQRTVEPVDLELGLGELRLALVQRD